MKIVSVSTMPRIVILTEGKSTPLEAKTATGILRYRPADVVALLDTACLGKTAGEVLGVGGTIPFVGRLEDVDGDTLLIGIAPAGGQLPEAWRAIVREAISSGMHIVSGLHTLLNDDPELAALARKHGVELHDVRQPREPPVVAQDKVRFTACHRVHTVGNDCSVGKMVTALEITRGLKERGRTAEFLPTGQTGILIAGGGVPVDHVVSDFVAGVVEREVVRRAASDFVIIEGQGCVSHPLYSGVTLGLLHGCAPQSLVLVADPTRKTMSGTQVPVLALTELIEIYERLASYLAPSRVVAIAANTSTLSQQERAEFLERTEAELGLVTSDVVREGPDRIAEALLARDEELK